MKNKRQRDDEDPGEPLLTACGREDIPGMAAYGRAENPERLSVPPSAAKSLPMTDFAPLALSSPPLSGASPARRMSPRASASCPPPYPAPPARRIFSSTVSLHSCTIR